MKEVCSLLWQFTPAFLPENVRSLWYFSIVCVFFSSGDSCIRLLCSVQGDVSGQSTGGHVWWGNTHNYRLWSRFSFLFSGSKSHLKWNFTLTGFLFTCLQILIIPVKALIAVGTLKSSPQNIVMPPSFPVSNVQTMSTSSSPAMPVQVLNQGLQVVTRLYTSCSPQGKVVHQGFNMQSSFTQKVRLQQIRSLTEDIRFYYKRLRNNKDELEPRRKSKVENQHPKDLKMITFALIYLNLFFRWQIFILMPACSVEITVMWACPLCWNVSLCVKCSDLITKAPLK